MSGAAPGVYDLIVVGGGPAGSTAAALVAQAGHRVLLLDRDRFPRFRIGESLMPATYWTLERLGLLDRMRASSFPRKHSVQFFGKDGRSGMPFYFSEIDAHKSSVTWQVDRAEFDLMLLDQAARAGVEVRQGVSVKDVLFEGDRAVGVALEQAGELRSRVVLDATGQRAMLSRKLGLREFDPELRHASFYTRYTGAQRDPGIDEGATLILQTETPRVWFWYIPLPHDTVSVGVVGPIGHLLRGRQGDPQQVYDEELARCPALRQRVATGRQVADVTVLRDFSYISRRIAGDGWVLAGDAFGFLDPIYSTGVFFALKSAELAADSILAGLDRGELSGAALGRHGDAYLAGMESMRKLVYAYYDESFRFADFLREHPDCKNPLVHLLVGNVFRISSEELFRTMGRFCRLPEARRLRPGETGR